MTDEPNDDSDTGDDGPAVQRGLAQYLPTIEEDPEGKLGVDVPLERIHVPPREELRASDEELERLADSIREEGLLQPVVLRPNGDDEFEIVAGRHRTYAHKLLGLDEVPALVRRDMDEAGAAVATGIENLQRKDIDPYEEAQTYQDAIDAGLTQKEVAERVGVSPATVSKRLKLLDLGEDLGRMAGDVFTLEEAELLAPISEYPEMRERLIERLHEHGRSHNILHSVSQVACSDEDPLACEPFDWHFIDSVGKNDVSFHRVKNSDAYADAIDELETVQFGDPDQRPNLTLCLETQEAKAAVNEAKQAIREEQQEESSGTPGRSKRDQERLEKKRKGRMTRSTGLEYLVKHLDSRTSFGEDIVKVAYRTLLKNAGQVASTKAERAALRELLEDHVDEEQSLTRGLPELVDELWDDDRLVLDRYVAAVAFLMNRDSSRHTSGVQWTPTCDEASQLATGKTGPQLRAVAMQRYRAKWEDDEDEDEEGA